MPAVHVTRCGKRRMPMLRHLLALCFATSAAAEGLYNADSPVTSYTTIAELPGFDGEPRFELVEFYSAW